MCQTCIKTIGRSLKNLGPSQKTLRPSSFTFIIFYMTQLLNLLSQAGYGPGCEWGRDGVMFMCAYVYDVALCGNTERKVAIGLWLVDHPCVNCFAPV